MPTTHAWHSTVAPLPTATTQSITQTPTPLSPPTPDFLLTNTVPQTPAGKKCARPNKWQVNTITLDDGTTLRAVEDPCVIQSVLDDYALAAPAEPTFLTRAQMQTQAKQYRSDKNLMRVYSEWWFKQYIADERWLDAAHHICDQPMQRVLQVARFLPSVNGNAHLLQLHFVVKSANNLPFMCELRNFRDEQPSKNGWRIQRSATDLAGPTPYPLYVTYATWSESAQSWQFQVSFPTGSYVRE